MKDNLRTSTHFVHPAHPKDVLDAMNGVNGTQTLKIIYTGVYIYTVYRVIYIPYIGLYI